MHTYSEESVTGKNQLQEILSNAVTLSCPLQWHTA
jgi:hypothetical protein